MTNDPWARRCSLRAHATANFNLARVSLDQTRAARLIQNEPIGWNEQYNKFYKLSLESTVQLRATD